MEEVKGLKKQIKPPSDNSTSVSQTGSSKSSKSKQKTWFGPCKQCGFRNYLLEDCYNKSKCSTCQSTDHRTKEYPEQVVVKKTLTKLKAQSCQASSSKKAPKIPKPFIPCKYCLFNDHHYDECEYYHGCDICGSIAHETTNRAKKTSSNNRILRIANQRSTKPTKKYLAFGENTRDLGSFGEETDEAMNLHQHCSRISPQKLETTSQITRDAVTNPTTTVSQDITMVSARTIQPII
ncbi:hypothetical protein Tco_1212031 [Tanacetum coccineum]